jgi:hypothetical protein
MDCKGLKKTPCNKKDGCTYRDGAKRKYCARSNKKAVTKKARGPCSGLKKTACKKAKKCTYRDGAKRKYCATSKVKQVIKKGKVKGHNPCSGLKKTPCNKKPYCQFTQGKRSYCRKRTFKKRGNKKQGGLATPVAPIKMPNMYYKGSSGLGTPVAPIKMPNMNYQGLSGLGTPVAPLVKTSTETTLSPSYSVRPGTSSSYKTPTVRNIQEQIKVNRQLAKEIRNFKGKGMTKIRALLKKSDPRSKEVQDALRSLLKKRERLQQEIKRNLSVIKKQKKDAQYIRHKKQYKQNKYLLEKSIELFNIVSAAA